MANNDWTGRPNVRQAMDYFIAQGHPLSHAAGIVANLFGESGVNPRVDPGDKGKAVGIAQWQVPRQKDYRAWKGAELKDASFEDQLAFVQHELTKGTYRSAGNTLSFAVTPEQAGEVVTRFYEKPLKVEDDSAKRAAFARELYDTYQARQKTPGTP